MVYNWGFQILHRNYKMAVVLENEQGALIDHALALKRVYCHVDTDAHKLQSYMMKTDLFEINEPFKMDSQVLAEKTAEERGIIQRKRKRKRKSELNIGEVEAQQYHSQIIKKVTNVHKDLISKAIEVGCIQDKKVHKGSSSSIKTVENKSGCAEDSSAGQFSKVDNNILARQAANIRVGDTSLTDVCQTLAPPTNSESATKLEMSTLLSLSECVNRVCSNDWSRPRLCQIKSETYIIPNNSVFLLSDFRYHRNIYPKTNMEKYDLIVLDPPWQNKSVKRKKMYGSLKDEDLLDISMEDLAAPGCVVVVWVTNRMKHIKFVKGTLFPQWSVTCVAEWQWLKITKYGEMTHDINSDHKKPYEMILIGRYNEFKPSYKEWTAPSPTNKTKLERECYKIPGCDGKSGITDLCKEGISNGDNSCESIGTTGNKKKELGSFPENYVIISVPCALHSNKPPLIEVLKRYLKDDPRCLELFARNLWPNWTSWGNEVLLHQHIDFYELG